MARVRSPNYPAISLSEAIARAKAIHEAEQHLAAPREVIAKHLGFNSLHGGANRIVSALTKYGLLEEVSGDKLKISSLGISILHPTNPAERASAIKEAASKPPLFSEIMSEWNGAQPSDANLRTYLIMKNFGADALDRVIQAYKDTIELVTSSDRVYNTPASKSAETPGTTKDEAREVERSKDPEDLFQSEMNHLMGPIGPGPLAQRLKVMMTGTSRLRVNADLVHAREVEKLIKILEANKALLEDDAKDVSSGPSAPTSDEPAS